MNRRIVLQAAGLAAAALLGAGTVQAQAFPTKSITLVVPNPPGGVVDTSARLVSDPLGRLIGQQADRLGVAEGIVVDGAGDRAFEQRKAVVLGGSRLGQNELGVLARHAMSVPVVVTPRR